MKNLEGKTILIGVTGSIACYKACEIVSKFKKLGADIHVIMSKNSTEFIQPLTFRSLSKNRVIVDMFDEPKEMDTEHISLAQKADIVLIVPATANIVGKVANGIADDMLSTTIMATKATVIFALAMNTNMYENKIFQNNLKKLREYNYDIIEPISGRLACGDTGKGKLEDTEKIVQYVLNKL